MSGVVRVERQRGSTGKQRIVPGVIDVRGAAPTHLNILLNDAILIRAQGAGAPEDFHQAVPVDNSTSAVTRHLRVQAVDTATMPPEVATERRAVFVPQTPEVFVHDADGNLTEDGRWRYTWDAENRLVAMETKPAAVTAGAPRQRLEFLYDDQARRIRKRAYLWDLEYGIWNLQATRLFLWDGWTLLAELMVSEYGERVPAAAYVWGREQVEGAGDGARQLALVRHFAGPAPGDYAPSYGHNYNIAGYVNLGTGELAAAYEYGAFGEPVSVSGPQAREFSFRFSTKYADDETDLSYFGFRYYSPSAGRWLSRDPIGERGPDGPNLYAYVGNNPTNLVDPFGLSSAAAPDPFDPCKDPCGDLLESIRQLARHVRGRYNDMLLDVNDLYGTRRYGKMSWQGHQKQFIARRSQLRDAIKQYNDRGCGQKQPLPSFVTIEALREAPAKSIRYELSAFDRWMPERTISNETLDTMEKGAWATVGIGVTGLTFGLAGPAVAGGGLVLGTAAAAH